MSEYFTDAEEAAAVQAAAEGKTHMVLWGKSYPYGYKATVYTLPDLGCYYSGYTARKAFRALDRANTINYRELKRRAKAICCASANEAS